MSIASDIAQALPKFKKLASGDYIACCPAHDDNNPSLSIAEGDGKALVHCHAGCSQDAVVDALKAAGVWPEPEERDQNRGVEAIYDYTDEDGKLLYQIVRKRGKKFLQRYPDGVGGWIWRKHPRQVLYHLPEVLEAPIVFVVEGERDVDTLRRHGFVATTNAGGAEAKWLPEFSEFLRGRDIILIPDNDQPGWERVRRIARALIGIAARIRIYDDIPAEFKDVSDWFAAGHSETELIATLEGSNAL